MSVSYKMNKLLYKFYSKLYTKNESAKLQSFIYCHL